MSSLIGKTLLNRYNVREFLGRGGMAEVYKVWDSHRADHLAMKVLLEGLSTDIIFMRRFEREANTLKGLQHKSIIRFYGLEKEGRLAFMLTDFIEGSTLKGIIFDAGGALPLSQVSAIMNPVCAALSFAHREGFVHCDIKSENIMLNKHGEALLMDFGIARMADAATATMQGIGTPAYMSPEQIRLEELTPQSDIYSLGIVLYEMLTGGGRPFAGDQAQITGGTSEKIRWEHTHIKAPSPRKWNPNLSPALEKVVLKCLEKDPRKRYQDTIDLYNALERAIGATEEDLPERPPIQPDPPKKTPAQDEQLTPIPPPPPPDTPRRDVLEELRQKAKGFQKKGKEILNAQYAKMKLGWEKTVQAYQKKQQADRWFWAKSMLPLFAAIIAILGFAFSPTRSTGKLYFVSDRSGKAEIYALDKEGQLTQMTSSPGNAISEDVTATLRGKLYFTSDRSGKKEIYVLDENSRVIQMTTTAGSAESWDPIPTLTGKLYFTSSRSGKREIYALDEKSRVIQMTDTAGKAESWDAAPSLTGKIYFTSDRSGKREVYALDENSQVIQMTDTADKAESWDATSALNGKIYFVSDRSGKAEIYALNEKGEITQMTDTPRGAISTEVTSVSNGNIYFTSDRSGKKEIYTLDEQGKITQMTISPLNSQSWDATVVLQ